MRLIEMIELNDMTLEEMETHFEESGFKRFRAKQIGDWLYKKNIFDFSEMTNLSKDFREKLGNEYIIKLPETVKKQVSPTDNTTKFLFKLEDGNTIESVLLYHPKRITACISTQVGCKLNCAFCATGKSGFKRNLKTREIIGQILKMQKEIPDRIGNIVFMGMGEPFLNYDNLIKSIRILTCKDMFDYSNRRIAVSTAGIVPKMMTFASEFPEVVLSISLHAPNNRKRNEIMPINSKYPFEELIQAMKDYTAITSKRITVEYMLIKDFNDSEQDAAELAGVLGGMKVNVNLIPLNPVDSTLKRPSLKTVEHFQKILETNGIETVLRREKGTDIDGACGQLRIQKTNHSE